MAFKAILKVGSEKRTLLSYNNYLFDMWHADYTNVRELHPTNSPTLYDYMKAAKESSYAFKRYGEPMGGLFDFTIESTDNDDFFYDWFKSDDKKGEIYIKNGVIELYDSKDEYMPMRRIEFWDAWITDISEHHIAYSNKSMILGFTISPATIRVNKELVFQKSWWQTDINQEDAQPQEETKLRVKDVYWKKDEKDLKKYIDYPNYPVTLYIETMDYNEGDTATIILKSKSNRKFAGGKDELNVSGTVDADGIAIIENFKINYTL